MLGGGRGGGGEGYLGTKNTTFCLIHILGLTWRGSYYWKYPKIRLYSIACPEPIESAVGAVRVGSYNIEKLG